MDDPVIISNANSADGGPLRAFFGALRRDRLSIGILCFAVLIIAGLWITFEAQIARERETKIADVMRENTNLARAFEEHTIRSLRYVDEVSLSIKTRYEAQGRRLDLAGYYRELRPNPALLRDVVITDEYGLIITGTADTPRVSIVDREHFRVHAGADSRQVFLSRPVLGRANQKWSLFTTRRLNKPDGSFAGVIGVTVIPEYFSEFYRDVDLGRNGIVTLVGTDGVVRARLAQDSGELGQDISQSASFKRLVGPGSVAAATYVSRSAVDGIERIYSARRVRDYPLLLFVGTSMGDAIGPLAERARAYRVSISLVSVLTMVFALLLVFFNLRRTQQRAELVRASELLRQTGDLAKVGGWEFDVETGHLYWSPETCRIHEIDPPVAPALEKAIEFYAPEAQPLIKSALQEAIAHGTSWDLELPLITAKGRRIWARAQGSARMRDGRAVKLYGAFEDITERKQAEEAGDKAAQRLEIALEGSQISAWETDLVTNEIWLDATWARYLGYPAGETRSTFVQLLTLIHPDDQRAVSAAAVSAMKGETPRYSVDIRVRAADGGWRWVQSRGRVIERDEGGRPLRMSGTNTDITAQMHAEAVLREERERTRTYLDVIETMVVALDAQGRISTINRKGCEILGYTESALIGQPWFELCLPQPEGMTVVYPFFLRLMAGEFSSVTEYQENPVRTRSGELRQIAWHNAILRDSQGRISGTLSAGDDITERKRAELALQESEARYRTLIEWSPEPFVVHRDEKIVYANAAALALFGAGSSADLVGRDRLSVVHPDYRELAQERGSASERVGRAMVELKLLKLDGTPVDVEIQATSIMFDGAPAIHVAGRDITARKQAEAARASLEAQLRESQKMEAVGTLAGGVAHDFNNIIATILGNAELAREDALENPVALQSLDEIRKAGARARDLVQQILSFSRRQPTERRRIALEPVVEEAARLLRATLPARVRLQARCAAGVPPVLADATQIQQVIINLATNAMQAMRGGPGVIDIALDAVPLNLVLAGANPGLRAMHARHPGRVVRLTLKDTGSGMDEATMARIFEPFFTTKAVDEGTGLGLSVVHGIVQTHEGVILVDSQPGRGATFTVCLPAVAAADVNDVAVHGNAPPPAVAAERARGGVAEGRGLRLLYVDDDEALVFLVTRLLSRRGYVVSGFTEQGEALAALGADPGGFDLVLTDYNMPGMSGLDVAREVRAINKDLPVAIASGFIDEALRAQVGAAGVRELIFKATEVEVFCAAVQRLAGNLSQPGKAPA